jgi:FKBP-type peptidyl-prolyl cis-trans isomerase FkpA
MKKNLMFVALAAIGFASCNGGFKKGESGILYNIYTDKGNPKIKEGDFISANLVVKNDADSVISSSYDAGQQQPLIVPKPQFKGDIVDALKLLGEGDSATIKVSADSIFKQTQRPPSFKGKYIVYDIKVEKVIAKGKMTDQEFQSKVTDYVQAQATLTKNQEPGKIQKYIADKKLTVARTDSGSYYVITKKGTGPLVAPGDTVAINYTGTLVNGKMFDSNIKEDAIKGKLNGAASRPYAPIRFPVGQRKVIMGWEEGLQLLNKGAKATFIIPSKLGYGEQGNQIIGPFSPLVFDIEVVDIIHPTGAAPAAALPPAKK